ncbi:hypothetical protein MDV071.8 [Gallid alphaherpesvirus 2]|nr:hypothetical protein MDV071.8 [synthetic construct]AFX97982.1 hypothetical protein MDV071.8 [Gallid alphaherpesvirus 2]ACR02923.1 hypothetical protein MDV071.8 [synthetic construct]AQN77332.1 hypothetical protein [Gallid alphaherpesvirus 2]AQN77508.1 hypothetical protein [Gallid alphaherpesvirus 2]
MIKRKSTSAQLSELLTLCIGDRESYEGGGSTASSYVGNSAELLYLVTDSNCKWIYSVCLCLHVKSFLHIFELRSMHVLV